MSGLRKSSRLSSNVDTSKDYTIVVIKSSSDGKPAQQVAHLKTSLIQHMCNKCDKKYTTSIGLKRHLKFCSEANGDISLHIPKGTVTENHNDINSKNLNFVDEISPPEYEEDLLEEQAALKEKSVNPYDFDEENNSDENKDGAGDWCECCGEDKATAHKAGEFKCVVCNKYYKHRESYETHLEKFHHLGPGACVCPHCPISCPDKVTLYEHEQTHSPHKLIECKVCKKTFTRKYHLERHLVQKGCDGRPKSSFLCRVCGAEFSRKDNLREHLRIHAGSILPRKSYPCPYCSKEFKGKTMITIHLRTHTGETPFTCKTCPKGFKSKGALIKHERCHTGEKPYSCVKCDKKFAAKETLNRHLKTHLANKPHVCQQCGKSFIQLTQLKAHMFYHTGENAFQCDHCNRNFNRKRGLEIHVKYFHEGAVMYKCTQKGCKKTFKRKEDRKRHLIIHSDVKPFKCCLCIKMFRTKALMMAHVRTHRVEAPRACPRCPRAFIRADCLLRHMRTKHPQQYKAVLHETKRKKLETMKAKLRSTSKQDSSRLGTSRLNLLSREFPDVSEASQLEHPPEYELDESIVIAPMETRLRNRVMIDARAMEKMESMEDNGPEEQEVDLPLSEAFLCNAIQELLEYLVDNNFLEQFNWSDLSVDETLIDIIEKCGYTAITAAEQADRGQRLRENARLLLKEVINDARVVHQLDTCDTVDEVILQVNNTLQRNAYRQ